MSLWSKCCVNIQIEPLCQYPHMVFEKLNFDFGNFWELIFTEWLEAREDTFYPLLLKDNDLVLNVSKTKYLLFTSQRHKERDCNFTLNLLGKAISSATTFKYLGVVFDNFMIWKAHAEYVCKKMATTVGILGRIRSFTTEEAACVFKT